VLSNKCRVAKTFLPRPDLRRYLILLYSTRRRIGEREGEQGPRPITHFNTVQLSSLYTTPASQ